MTYLRHHPLFEGDDGTILRDDAGHILIAGRSGLGKTQIAASFLRAKLNDPRWGVQWIDPDGDLSPLGLEFLANPQHGVMRTIHYLKPASEDAFALPLLFVPTPAPQACHEKSVRAVKIFAEAGGFDDGQYGPRLTKFFYLGCLGLSLTGRSLIDLPELYSRGATHLREIVAAAYPYPFLADEMRSLDLLNDRTFAEYKDPLISRLMPIFGNPQLRRVFGPQRPLDLTKVFAARECVALDLSGLEFADARLVGNAYASLFYHEALQRPANEAAHTCLLIDEAFDFLAPLARGFDRLRKRHCQLVIVIQRLAQIENASDVDRAAMLSAALTNTNSKLCFGGLLFEDAELLVPNLWANHLDLQEWKERSARPTAVGNKKELVHSSSRAQHEAEHETYAETTSHTHGEAIGTMTAKSTSIGEFSASGDSAGMVMQAPAQLFGPNAPNAQSSPIPLTESEGQSSSRGSSEMAGTSSGSSHVSVDMHGEAVTRGFGKSRGTSVTEGVSETFVTDYTLLPTQMFSLPEQLFRLAGALVGLNFRECFVKIGNAVPFKTRTADVVPAFRSHFAKRVMYPIFHAQLRKRSPYLQPAAMVDADILQRLASLQPPPKPAVIVPTPVPVPLPIIDAPKTFASQFWSKQAKPLGDPPKPKPKKLRPGRKPIGNVPPEAKNRFTVIEGAHGDNE